MHAHLGFPAEPLPDAGAAEAGGQAAGVPGFVLVINVTAAAGGVGGSHFRKKNNNIQYNSVFGERFEKKTGKHSTKFFG